MSETPIVQPPWNIQELLKQLEEQYKAKGIETYWKHETATISSRLLGLAERLSERYSDPKIEGLGGSAVVLRVTDRQLSDQPCALKFPRPVPGKSDLLVAMMDKEISHLAKLRHGSIVRIHGRGRIQEPNTITASFFPYYIMDYVAGSSSSAYLRETEVNERSFIKVIHATVDALRYLHVSSTAHLDIKPDNILIGVDGLPIIADLGTAKALVDGPEETIVACTFGYADPDLVRLLESDPSDSNRAKGKVARNKIDPKWDLFSLGKTILNWLGFDLSGKQLPRRQTLSPYCRKYLLLMSARMLRGSIEQWLEDRVGLDRRLLKELSYVDADQVLQDVRKLSGEYSIVDLVPELNAYDPGTVQVAGEAPTTYSQRLGTLLDHPALRRLGAITQLGLVSQVYPTATHSRLEHSLGTYHNACRFVLSLYYDPFSPLFRQMVDASDVRAVLVAALLHDVGQFPLAHDLEEIDYGTFGHAPLGPAVIRGVRETKKAGATKIKLIPFEEALKPWELTPERVIQILEAKPDKDDSPVKDRLLHSIVDGPMDADKLDYLRRDSDRLRVPYGRGIDIERVLRSLTVILDRKGKGLVACVGVHEKGKVAAEFVGIARYAMFSQAYWQHTVRSMKAMLARAVLKLLLISEEKGERWRNEFRSAFENFVFSLPDSLYRTPPVQQALFAENINQPARSTDDTRDVEIGGTKSTIAATDVAVIAFLKSYLVRESARESELLDDLLARSLYKRLFVFSRERSPKEWKVFLDQWDRLSPVQKIRVYTQIETSLIPEIDKRLQGGPPTITLDNSQADRFRKRVEAQQPIILIDVPGPRPGADIPLYYILEAQRRALRKDDRAVGDAHISEVWQEFGVGLRDRAGKIRVFCHPKYIDALEAAVDRSEFVRLFERAVTAVR